MIHNLTIHIGRKSSGKSSACHVHHTWWFLTRYHLTRVKDCSTNGRLTMTAATFKGKQQEEQEGFPYWTSSPRFVALSGKRMDVWRHVWRDIHQSRRPSKVLPSVCEVWNISALPYVCICAKNNGGIERLQERVQHGRLSGLHWQHWRNSHSSWKGLCFVAPSASWLQVKKYDAHVQSNVQSLSPNLAYNIRPPW